MNVGKITLSQIQPKILLTKKFFVHSGFNVKNTIIMKSGKSKKSGSTGYKNLGEKASSPFIKAMVGGGSSSTKKPKSKMKSPY